MYGYIVFFKNNSVFFYCNILLFLFLVSLLITQVQKIYKLSNKVSLIVKFVILASFNIFFEIEGVRNFLSYIILATFVFIDFYSHEYKKKILCILAYGLAIGLHPAALPFVLFRIIFILNNKLIRMVLAVFAVTYTILLPQILHIFSSFSYFVNDNSKTYLYGQSNFSSYTGFNEVLFSTFLLISLILELLIFYKCNFQKKTFAKLFTVLYSSNFVYDRLLFKCASVFKSNILIVVFKYTDKNDFIFKI
ncbi:hypothetical protein [Lactobacillus hamsteri]|uniref:hypothetical protein n=1 Tax=Lactobacillus hamsteri TaxID=96565 RepID=UPI0004690889|nr:hypothetical protein [Lactobacillus hamsteri]